MITPSPIKLKTGRLKPSSGLNPDGSLQLMLPSLDYKNKLNSDEDLLIAGLGRRNNSLSDVSTPTLNHKVR